MGLVVVHLLLAPLCRFEIFLNKNFKVTYMQQNSNTTVKSLLPIPSSIPPRPPSQGVIQSPSPVYLFSIPWTAAHQASLSFTNCRSLPRPMCIDLVMPSTHLILCCPLLLLPSIFPTIRVFSNESTLRTRWPKY